MNLLVNNKKILILYFLGICSNLNADSFRREEKEYLSPNKDYSLIIKPTETGSILIYRVKSRLKWENVLQFIHINAFLSDEGNTILLISDSEDPGILIYNALGRNIKSFKAESFLSKNDSGFLYSVSHVSWYGKVEQFRDYIEISVITNSIDLWGDPDFKNKFKIKKVKIPWN